jgi:hypothetical protein
VDLNQNFDYEKYHLCTIQNNIIEHLEKGKVKIEPVKDAEVVKAIKNLKIGKLPDIDGITGLFEGNYVSLQFSYQFGLLGCFAIFL